MSINGPTTQQSPQISHQSQPAGNQRVSSQQVKTLIRSRMPNQSPLQPFTPGIPPTNDGVVALVTLGDAWTRYLAAHDYRKSTHHRLVLQASFNEVLTVGGLQEWHPVAYLTKELGRRWIQWMQVPKLFPKRRPPKAVTIMAKVQHVRHFLRFCVGEDFVEVNTFASLALPSRAVTASRQHKTAFTDSELVTILRTLESFAISAVGVGRAEQREQFRMVVLLLMVTGARANEIIQLDHANVQQREAVWCVDISVGGGRSLKNLQSARLLPLHSAVLGVFLPWFHTRPAGPLFPALTPGLVSCWFSRELLEVRAKIKTRAVSLHSLRHTVTHKLVGSRCYDPIRNRLLGHAFGKSVEMTSYTRGLTFSLPELSESLEAITFPPLG